MRRGWFWAAIGVGIAAIVIAAIAMRLTADDDSSSTATSWADSVCSSLADWESSIESIATAVGSSPSRESLEQALADATDATDELVSDLRALGAPDVESGDRIKQELESSVDTLQSQYETLKSDAEQALEAGSPTEILAALTGLAPQFQTLFTGVQQLVTDLQSEDVAGDAKDELEQAFRDASSCQQLASER